MMVTFKNILTAQVNVFDSFIIIIPSSLLVEGDSDWYGKKMVRALSENGITEAATRCGANIVSPDYINPDDMKMFVWSWDQQVGQQSSSLLTLAGTKLRY